MRFLLSIALFGLFSIQAPTVISENASDSASTKPKLSPQRFFVATVIDLSNDEIIRDALTLFRSIRVFGGSFNNATFIAYLTGETPYADWRHSNLIEELSMLGIKYDFSDSVGPGIPKTLNKYFAFYKFDSSMYDYFVWLDADVLVLRDPMPHLQIHMTPGQIQCIPDPYNYLENVPNLNGSRLFWNHKMGEQFLDGNRDFYSYGICNTGILIFDRMSLPRFVAEIEGTFREILELTSRKSDRFLDSAVFSSIINKLEISVIFQTYEFNFMSFLEVEIREAVGDEIDMIFVHMIATSSFYCGRDTELRCFCTYENPLAPTDSILRKKLYNILMDSSICPILNGEIPPPSFPRLLPEKSPHARNLIDDDGASAHYDGLLFHATIARSDDVVVSAPCVFSWPPTGMVHLNQGEDVRLPLRIYCFADERVIDVVHDVVNQSFVTLPVNYNVNLTALLSVSPSETTVDVTSLFSVKTLTMDDISSYFSQATLFVDSKQLDYSVVSPDFNYFKSQGVVDVAIIMTAVSAHSIVNVTVNFTNVDERFSSRSVVRLQHNILTGRKSIILESHALIVPYLERWGQRSIGVIFCCDTTSGLLTVESMIKSWLGNRLIIYISNQPPLAQNATMEWSNWQSHIEDLCIARYNEAPNVPLLKCSIISSPGARRHGHVDKKLKRVFSSLAIRQLDLSFVYIDTFASHRDYLHILNYVLHSSSPGAIVFGTRYVSHSSPFALPSCCYFQESNLSSTRCLAECPSDIKMVVDTAAYKARLTPMVTFREDTSPFDSTGSNLACKAFRKWQLMAHEAGILSTDNEKQPLVSIKQALRLQTPTVAEAYFAVSVTDCAPAWYIHVAAESVDRMWGYI